MKIRTGFVSNSSSSSFTCHVTGDEVKCDQNGYWNRGIRECEHGHGFPPECTIIPDKLTKKQKTLMLEIYSQAVNDMASYGWYDGKKWKPTKNKTYDDLQEEIVTFFITDWETEGNVGIGIIEDLLSLPQWMCPICNMQVIGFYNAMKFMLRTFGKGDRKVLDKIIKNKFSTLKELEEFVEGIELI